ncbi:MAG: nucleoside deaminase [Chitinispirillaceae bacterium]
MYRKAVEFRLPEWIDPFLKKRPDYFPKREERMRLVIELAKTNVFEKTGGPFAAAIFDDSDGRLISPGVNMVTTTNQSIAHAEMVAIMQAQFRLSTFDLGGPDMPSCELVTSTAPCAMCLGAVPWSGVRSLVCGARDEDARSIGFDEGSKRTDWVEELEKRRIKVYNDMCREEAVEVLKSYVEQGGVIYNGRTQKN